MNYTDMHCDTSLAIYDMKCDLKKNTLHVDLEKAKKYNRYSQIYAIWSKSDRDNNENYEDFFKVREYFLESICESSIALCRTGEEYKANIQNNLNTAILAVEGGKLISDDLSRLDVLYENDVRFFTLVWSGMCDIGGAFNTNEGLTQFGKRVISKLNELNMIIDVSHASEKMIYETLELTAKPIIASHSNAKSVCNHKRNLTDSQFGEIKKLGGIVGISLCGEHVAEKSPYINDVLKHIDYYLSLGGENVVCFGCDFDGASLVNGISDLADVEIFINEFAKMGYKDNLIENIMFRNADNFIINNMK